MKKYINKVTLTLFGIIIGAVAGYFYWQQIGCVSDFCSITSKPLNSTIHGALLGGFVFSILK